MCDISAGVGVSQPTMSHHLKALRDAGLLNSQRRASWVYVVINGVLPEPADDDDPLASAIYRREQAAIAAVPEELRMLPLDAVDLKANNIVGIDALATLFTPDTTISGQLDEPAVEVPDAPLAALVDQIADARDTAATR